MTKDEALKLALEAMEYADACLKKQLTTKTKHEYAQDLLLEAGTAIREALSEQPAQQQEPVAWYGVNIAGVKYLGWKYEELDDRGFDVFPLYTSLPASKPWVGLTDEEIHKMTVLMGINPEWKAEMEIVRSVVRNLEAKLREKNA